MCYCKRETLRGNYFGPRYKIKNPLSPFFRIHMMSMCAKFQLSSFKTEGGDRGDRWTDRQHPPTPIRAQDFLCIKISKLLHSLRSLASLVHSVRGG